MKFITASSHSAGVLGREIFLLFIAVRTIAAAAPAIPNIMQGKKPDMYIPRLQLTSAEVSPAQKWVRSPKMCIRDSAVDYAK